MKSPRFLFGLMAAIALLAVFPQGRVAGQSSVSVQELVFDKPLTRELAGGQTDEFALALAANQYVEVTLARNGIVLVVTLLAPDGHLVAEGTGDTEAVGDDTVRYQAQEAGTYKLMVRPSRSEANRAQYQVRLAVLRPGTDADRERVAAHQLLGAGSRLMTQHTAAAAQQAASKFREASQRFRAVEDKPGEAIAQGFLAGALFEQNLAKEALPLMEQSLAMFRALGDRVREAEMLNAVGWAHRSLGQPQQSQTYHQQALTLSRALGNRSHELSALNNLGLVTSVLGDEQASCAYYEEALKLLPQSPDRSIEGFLSNNLASSYRRLGEPYKAREYFQRALAFFRATGQRAQEAIAMANLGAVHFGLDEYQPALESVQAALAIHRQSGNRRYEAVTLRNMALVYLRLGDKDQADSLLAETLAICRALTDRSCEAATLTNIGRSQQGRGQFAQALTTFQQALALHRAVSNRPDEVERLIEIGQIYGALGETTKALAHFQEALPLTQQIRQRLFEAKALLGLGQSYRALGDDAQAVSYLTQTLTISRAINARLIEVESLRELAGLFLKQGAYAQARAQIEQAIELIETFRVRIASLDLRASYRSAWQRLYGLHLEILVRQHEKEPQAGFAAEAFRASERARARSFLEMLAEAHVNIQQGVSPALLERERESRQRLSAKNSLLSQLALGNASQAKVAALRTEIQQLLAEYRGLISQIRVASPKYAALALPEPLSLADVQQQVLEQNSVLLEYCLGQERSFLFAVTKDAIQVFELPKEARIEDAARRLHQLATESGQPHVFKSAQERLAHQQELHTKYRATASDLSQMLLAPVQSLLGRKRLLIVADGSLHYLPFAALPDPRAENAKTITRTGVGPVSGTPLIVNHELVLLPSASTLAVMRRELSARPRAPKTIAVLADPIFDRQDARVLAKNASARTDLVATNPARLPGAGTDNVRDDVNEAAGLRRLPFSRQEAETIAALTPRHSRKVALDFDANRALAVSDELAQYQILHFATHGVINQSQPELSGLVFSRLDKQGTDQDGFLRAMDLYNLRLPAELIVLSGCRTALGKEVNGEGLIGLTRGFMYAGARRVLASLWQVNDAATAALMKQFYQGVLQQKLTPAAALRAAQVAMWQSERWHAPYYWAPFVLQGEW